MNPLQKLLDFLSELDARKVHHRLSRVRPEAIMVEIAVPGERWEVEFFADGHLGERVAVVEGMQRIADASGRPGGAAELGVVWVLRRPEVTAAIVGGRTAEQARANAALAGAPLTADEEAAIDALLAEHPLASREYGHGEPPVRPAG